MPGPLSTPDKTKTHLTTSEARKHAPKGFSGKTARKHTRTKKEG
jgi:hypothetical protein